VTGDGYLTRHLETRKQSSLSKGDVDGLVGRMTPVIRAYVAKQVNVAVGIVGEEVAAVEKRLTRTPEQLAEDVSKGVDAALAEKLVPLETRLAQLEGRHELRYLGVYQSGTMYPENSCVTFDGSIWVARAETNARPGGNALWTLAVKRIGKR